MRTTIKRIIEAILAVIACVSFVMMTGEAADGSVSLPWSLSWLAVLAVCCKILDKMGVFGEEESV